ncbi:MULTISPECIES: hypothetical protein [Rhodanobacter]|uniref:hypothetical protein n=1 Tax=Rhodanobacter TaxID=75309 RepID=UPI0004186D32|nr:MULTISPECIES: hypothetical protein [Rhodanobacter]UJJ54587.1 hypothetical protein LRK53_16810 [Rhodanobacter thiooxydans]
MSNFVAMFDACVLYRESLRNLLLHLALSGLYRARWTARVHEEWIRALCASVPIFPATIWSELDD